MKQITLYGKYGNGKYAQVSDEDYEELNQYKWGARKDRNTYYATRKHKNRTIYMHRTILGITNPKVMTDHIDHNGLNNQRSNLRIASYAENSHNKGIYRAVSSKYRGVTFNKRLQKWISQIQVDGRKIYLGLLPNTPEGEKEAAIRHDIAAKKHHGEFANLNFLD